MDGEWMVGVSEISVGNGRLISDGLELALFAKDNQRTPSGGRRSFTSAPD